MRLEILQAGHPVLRRQARALAPPEILSREVQKLIADMRETMEQAPGVGLAAPQVGFPLQLAVIEDREEYWGEIPAGQLAERERRIVPFQVIINPTLRPTSLKTVEFNEGCLSLDGFTALVTRAHSVVVECLNERGELRVIQASGWHARILQHEFDHLQGTLYIDRMHSRSFSSLDHWKQFWKGQSASEMRAALGGTE